MAPPPTTILPAGPARQTHSSASNPASTRKATRRELTLNACVGCRKKRSKCNGRSPCQRCVARGEHCRYEDKTSVSKDDLRAEVENLKLQGSNHRAVLSALLLEKDGSILQRLRSGETVDAVAKGLAEEGGPRNRGQKLKGRQEPSLAPSGANAPAAAPQPEVDGATTGTALATAPLAIGEVPSGLNLTRGNDAVSASGLLTPVGASPASTGHPSRSVARRYSFDFNLLTDRYPIPADSTWTRLALKGHVVDHLISLFFAWEIPPFTILSQPLFIQDYYQGGRDFCSPALVNAICSVATRYLEPGQFKEVEAPHDLSQEFYVEASRILAVEADIPNLASVQALGLLALREMSCGRELEAQELCIRAVRDLTTMDFEDLEGHRRLTECLSVRSVTFSGLLSLARAITLITYQLSPASTYGSPIPITSEMSPHTGEDVAAELQERLVHLNISFQRQPKPDVSELLSNFIFEMTEQVYVFLILNDDGFDSPKARDHLATVYRKCLRLYESITGVLNQQGMSSRYNLFAHIYFHFCLLTLFRPFMDSATDVAGASPQTVCAEAVRAILDLTQNYADLFTLDRTPCFIPYFVFAAGLAGIVMENQAKARDGRPVAWRRHSLVASSTTGSSPAASATDGKSPPPTGMVDGTGDSPMTGTESTQALMSPARTIASSPSEIAEMEADARYAQAVRHLSQMGSGHSAAAQAERVLRNFDRDPSSHGASSESPM